MTVSSASAISFGRTAPEVTSVFENAVTNSMSAKPTAVLIPVSFMPVSPPMGRREADPYSSPDRTSAARTSSSRGACRFFHRPSSSRSPQSKHRGGSQPHNACAGDQRDGVVHRTRGQVHQILLYSLPGPETPTVGEASSHVRRTLNPLFVEWLMGWPPGWTFLALMPPASSGLGCSETALCRFKADMRSALFSLGLPPEAPPAQTSLFG